jgi:single-strand DNA-binding protein
MLLGNLGSDPELRFTNGGQAVLNMRIATTETYLDKNKVRQERTEWHNVVLWGKRAEALAKFLTKGSRIFVEGGLHTSSYEKNGEKRYKTEVNASNIILTGGKGGGRDDSPPDDLPGPSRKLAPPGPDEVPPDDFTGGEDCGF